MLTRPLPALLLAVASLAVWSSGAAGAIRPPVPGRALRRRQRQADRRRAGQRLRLAPARRADRHLRQPALGVGEPQSRHPVGGDHAEGRRPGQCPHRAGDGAALGARAGVGGDRRSARAPDRDARPGRQRGDAANRHRGRRARRQELPGSRRQGRRGQGQDRALQRPLHQLRRDGAVPLGRRRGRGPGGRRRRVRPRGRSDGPAHAAHRQHELRRGAGEDPGGGDCRRGRQSHPAAERARPAGAGPAPDGGPRRARRRVGQRLRRGRRPRAAERRSSWSAATSTRGTSAPARRTTASAASSPGRRCG